MARAGDRFVLRLASPPSTIGGGVVVDPLPPRRRAAVWDRLERGEESLGRILREAGGGGVALALLPVRSGCSPATVGELLRDQGLAVTIGGHVYHPSALQEVRDAIERLVHEEHRRAPLGDGLAAAGLASRLRVSDELADRAVADLVASDRIERRGSVLTAHGWRPVVGAEDDAYRGVLLAAIRAGGAEPPDVAALADLHHRDPIPILRILEREGRVVSVESGRFYAAEEVERLVTKLRDGMTESREYSPSELRELLGLSRKYLIPFLEYCDRKRLTERRATGRVRVASMA